MKKSVVVCLMMDKWVARKSHRVALNNLKKSKIFDTSRCKKINLISLLLKCCSGCEKLYRLKKRRLNTIQSLNPSL